MGPSGPGYTEKASPPGKARPASVTWQGSISPREYWVYQKLYPQWRKPWMRNL